MSSWPATMSSGRPLTLLKNPKFQKPGPFAVSDGNWYRHFVGQR
jgi:hypothetical protein